MKTVFLFIANYVYTSDFLETEYIKYLSSKYKVVVFMPKAALQSRNYYQNNNILYIGWDLHYPKFWNLFGKQLRYSLSRVFDNEPVLQRNYAKNLKGIKRRGLRIISYLFPKSFFNPKLFSLLEQKYLPLNEDFVKLVSKYKPEAVLTSTPGFNPYDAEAITLAKKMGIKTVAVNFSWDNLYNGVHNIRKTDFLILWNGIMKQTAIRMQKYSPETVFVSGPMRFDEYFSNNHKETSRKEFLLSKELNPDEKTILISTVTDGNYPDEEILIKDLIDLRGENKLLGFPNIFIRLHPKDNLKKYEMFRLLPRVVVEEAGEKKSVDLGSSTELTKDDLLNLKYTLKYCDVVINYASTITLEAFIFDKPVINIGYPEKYLDAYNFSHYKPIVEEGAVRLAKSLDEIVIHVNMYLANPTIDSEKRQQILKDFIHYFDGKSYMRNVDALTEILNRK